MLSESVSKALHLTGGPEVVETAHIVSFMDKFFDALNVTNYTNVTRENSFNSPTSLQRTSVSKYAQHVLYVHYFLTLLCTFVQWLEKYFLPYLENWEKWAHTIPDLTATEWNNMLLSAKTRLGLNVTCKH